MKEFFKEKKTVILAIFALIILLATAAVVYFFVLDQDLRSIGMGNEVAQEQGNEDETAEEEVTPQPEYDLSPSSEAIDTTYIAAKEWADDAVLYNCSGLPTTVQFPDVTYEYMGAEGGEYYRWMCTYYSKGEEKTKIFAYIGGELQGDNEAVGIGEYGSVLYDSIDYPTDLGEVVDSATIYATAVENGLDDGNYVNVYLTNVRDYGFVWKIEERNRTEENENEIGVLENTYIFDIYTGKLEEITQEEIY